MRPFTSPSDHATPGLPGQFDSPHASIYQSNGESKLTHGDVNGSNPIEAIEELTNRVAELERALSAFQGSPTIQRDRFGFGRRSIQSAEHLEQFRAENSSHSDGSRGRNGEYRFDDVSQGWKLEIKRWKRVNNRFGSSDLYDESQKIEDIRRKEHEIRSGGYVLSVYEEYDLDGTRMHTLLEIHSTPLLVGIVSFWSYHDKTIPALTLELSPYISCIGRTCFKRYY